MISAIVATEAMNEILARKLQQGFLRGSIADVAVDILKSASVGLSSSNTSEGASGGGVATPSGNSALYTAFCLKIQDRKTERIIHLLS